MSRLFFLLLFCGVFRVSGVAVSAPDEVIRVSPESEALKVTGVPFLHEKVAEALNSSDGLRVSTEKPFQWAWVSEDSNRATLEVQVKPGLYDKGIFTVWDWNNRAIAQQEVEAGDAVFRQLEVGGTGVYLLTLDGYKLGECVRRLVRSVAFTEDLNRVRETWKKDEFFLGVCAFPGRYHWSFQGEPTLPAELNEDEAREIEATLLARLGFQVVRTDESMEMGERTLPGGKREFSFDFTRMDKAVSAYTGRGFQLALQLMNAPDWGVIPKYESRKKPLWRYPRQEEVQRAYVRALVKRYGEHARFVQVFNEPDQTAFWSGTQEEYVHQFSFTVDEVRKQLPDVPVVNGGYSLVDRKRTRFFVKALQESPSYAAYHSHGDLADLAEDLKTIRAFYRGAGDGDVRFVNTEMGYDGWRLDQERRKGQYVPQKTLFCWANDHAGVLLFGGRMTLGPGRTNQDFGFLDHYFCPRPVYGSISAMVSTLEGASFVKSHSNSDGIYVYQFEKGSRTIFAAFSTGDAGRLAFETDAESVIDIDEMGNRREVPLDELLEISVGNYPRYWELPTKAGSSVKRR